jgi:hypothetical protein
LLRVTRAVGTDGIRRDSLAVVSVTAATKTEMETMTETVTARIAGGNGDGDNGCTIDMVVAMHSEQKVEQNYTSR